MSPLYGSVTLLHQGERLPYATYRKGERASPVKDAKTVNQRVDQALRAQTQRRTPATTPGETTPGLSPQPPSLPRARTASRSFLRCPQDSSRTPHSRKVAHSAKSCRLIPREGCHLEHMKPATHSRGKAVTCRSEATRGMAFVTRTGRSAPTSLGVFAWIVP
jgi:hypothetical protein